MEGGHQERNGRTRHAPPGGLQEEDEDMEGGLDEDWGQDVDIIELQNRLPDYDKSKNRGPGMQSGGEVKETRGRKGVAAAAAAATVAAAAAAAAAAGAEEREAGVAAATGVGMNSTMNHPPSESVST